MFAEFIQGTERTIVTVLGVVVCSSVFGLALGSLSSRRGSAWDSLTSRLLEVSAALHLLIVIPLLQNLVSATTSTVIALGYYQGLRLARLCRNEMRFVRRHAFVVGSRALGLSAMRTEWAHVLPHAAPALAVNVALTPPLVVSSEAALAFVGLDGSPSWGALIVSPSPFSLAALLSVVVFTLLSHLAAERLTRRLLPHAFHGTSEAALATAPDRSN